MSPDLHQQLAAAEAEAERLRRSIAAAPCREVGCNMKHIGGRNAGCSDSCACSIPVHICTRCGDCDYGQNPEADAKRAACAARDAE